MTEELRFRYSDDRRPRVNQYLRSHRVGKGQHGEVWVCWDLSDNRREVAIKAVKRNNPRAEKLNLLRRKNLPTSPHTPLTDKLSSLEQKIRKEIAIMKKCRHGHIVRLLEVIDDKLNERIYMVMEYLGGGEIKWRDEQNQPILKVDQCRRICRDVILGLEYLHYQGIIHRDIKPANLLWTADRQMVKITDFGVSHFSYAQRLAAAGRGQRAGTPPFLAPEVIAEYSNQSHRSILRAPIKCSSAVPHHRQPITKAIDVWALGVTLYCLLFGHIPFRAMDSSEYVLYNVICNSDWVPDEFMGVDHRETGGRRPPAAHGGCIVMNLLDKFLQKDVRKRITLDNAKRYPWFLNDILNPEEWLRQTSPSRNDIVVVTENETRTAMTTARFTWGWHRRLTNRISSLFRNVRTPRPSSSRNPHDDYDDDDDNSSHKTISQASSPLDSSSGASISQENAPNPGPSADIMARRSDEVLRHPGKGSLRSGHEPHGVLTAARRASSWGDPVNYVEDVTSLNSGEALDDDVMLLGAGGISNEPTTFVSNLPWGLNHATEAINHSPPVLRHPQPERLHIVSSVHSPSDTSHDSAHNRHLRSTTASPSPLHHVTSESDLIETSDDEYDDDLESDSSFFRDTHRQRQPQAFPPSTSQLYDDDEEDEGDEEDEDTDEETVPIEFKRRRPSVSTTAVSPLPSLSPPSDFCDDARAR
ncbi:kinase-like domain-containing protein [Melanogaster broomeanus]|nr:kinase-like domain-containing protein [Melanogaster broomeanus]